VLSDQDLARVDEAATVTSEDVAADLIEVSLETQRWDGNAWVTVAPPAGAMLPDAGTIPGQLSLSGALEQSSPASWTISGIADLEPGEWKIIATVQDDEGDMSTTDVLLTVAAEDAMPNYAAPLLFATDPKTPQDLDMDLRVIVQDITFFARSDTQGGNVTRSDVPTGTVTLTITDPEDPGFGPYTFADVPVQSLDADPLTGVATYHWTLDDALSKNDVIRTLEIDIQVGGYYTGSDSTLVTVAKPDGDFITGGGYLVESASYGGVATMNGPDGTTRDVPLEITAGSKLNFGFAVQYNKQLTHLKGRFNSIVRMADGTQMKIKSTATRSLGVSPHPTIAGASVAVFESKANLQLLDTGESLGGLTMYVEMTDYGEPGSDDATPDTLGYSLWDGNRLILATNWNGSQLVEQGLGGGNLKIHTELKAPAIVAAKPILSLIHI